MTDRKSYSAALSDFGWAVTWDGESVQGFCARQDKRFRSGLPVHSTPESALKYWARHIRNVPTAGV